MAKLYNVTEDEKKKASGAPVNGPEMITKPVSKGKTPDNSWDNTTMPAGPGTEYYGGHAIPEKPKPPGNNAAATSAPSTPDPQKWDSTAPASVFGDTSNPELQAQYENWLSQLQQAQGNKPTWNGSQYDGDIQSLYQQLLGRDPFKYDSATDPLFQQYKQDYIQQGKMAMRDTMGQAAALTGGYGSSYGQAVGQQQFDTYLQKLAEVLPETYSAALNAYNAEGDRLNGMLSTAVGLHDDEYQQYLDALSQHNTDVNYLTNQANTAYDHMTDAEDTAYSHMQDQYEIQQDNYETLYTLMQAGKKPTKEEANAAGLTHEQAMWLFNYIQEQQAE